MGGPKADLVLDGETLAARAARSLRSVADPVFEVGPGYTDLPAVAEPDPGSGPLAALAAAVGAGVLPADRPVPVLVLAVDMPLVTVELLRLLAEDPSADSVVPVDRSSELQPLCARWSAAALAAAVDLVARGERSMRALLAAVPVDTMAPACWTPFAGPAGDPFTDIDTPDDLDRITSTP